MLSALFLCTATAAFAQLGEVGISFGKTNVRNGTLGTLGLSTDTGGVQNVDVTTDANFRFDIKFTINSYRFFGHEFGYGYNRGKLAFETTPRQEVGMPIHQGFYNFLAYALPEGSKVRPFVAGGVHFSTFYPPGTSVFGGNGVTKFGLNYGGGIKVRVSDIFLVRFDVREFAQGKPDLYGFQNQSGWIRLLATTAGLSFVF
jgi:hypothetical protein